ncbi:hypothetical protein NE857_33995 (plasmid) [Nocardiopsis exhalans]|uniref:Uncharacterized protein n=1 Tax=Nocardiopsis exhalans TaxID=163604 RepID=A0ABY5DJS5_9ACTN|nr:hypothetical protein [Nocardiopsis exhalans]USY23546.1 hypothetical protein NE857_33995 [Nocardiopsis exhalans]
MMPTTGAAIRLLDHRGDAAAAALAMLLRQAHEAATTPGLPPEVEDAAHAVAAQVAAEPPRGWRRLLPVRATPEAREAATVAELLRCIDQADRCAEPVHRAAQRLTGVLIDQQPIDTA